MAKHVRITQHATSKPLGTGQDIHYKPGDIHEVGSPTMSETLANQLKGDGYAEDYTFDEEGDVDTVAQVGEFGGPVAAASPQMPNEAGVPSGVIPPRKAVDDANKGKAPPADTEKHHGKHPGSSRHTGTHEKE